ncbi:extracellular solute-binding protein [Macrococcus capreoli]|uniref:extracellular solute-binding protein n=1 Tax=Macrococcus capreoli TaxID=2982690 RepID=UPI0021D61375|nr:extracellular solute-binding protein [Macrococcus sp. TMW 2.2395]MCU7557419.1 extracellular solute-binding protein [Macrococcus sp. TMW 2.2395]
MVTILDIARKAGVSHGTVSNVINEKGNVSVDKIKKVRAAAEELGYTINNNAKLLRAGESNTVCLVIPNIDRKEYLELFEGLNHQFQKNDIKFLLFITNDNQQKELSCLKKIAKENPKYIISITSLNDCKDYEKELSIDKSKILFINRKPKNAKNFICFDFKQAAIDIIDFFERKKVENLCLAFHDETSTNQKELLNAIKKYNKIIDITVIPSDSLKNSSIAYDVLKNYNFDAVLINGTSNLNILNKVLYFRRNIRLPIIVTIGAHPEVYSENIFNYFQNYYSLGLNIADNIRENNNFSSNALCQNEGFDLLFEKLEENNTILKVLTLKSPSALALEKLVPDNIKLDIKSYEEVLEIVSSDLYKNYDLIRIDMAIFPWIGKKVFRKLNGLNNDVDKLINGLDTKTQNYYSCIGDYSYGLPLDPTVQMMFYRKDIFEDEIIKRIYFKENKTELKPPESIEDFDKVMKFLYNQYINNKKVMPKSVNVKNPILIAAEFLGIYYGLGGQIINKNIELNVKIGKEAIEKYFELMHYSKKEEADWWNESIDSFINGQTLMVIGFVNHLSITALSDICNCIGYSKVPGNKPLLGGGVIGIVNTSRNIDAAIDFILWLNSKTISKEITQLGGLGAQKRVYEEKEIHKLYPWLRYMEESIAIGVRPIKHSHNYAINIYEIENIIGHIIKENINNQKLDSEDIINQINLSLRTKKLKKKLT